MSIFSRIDGATAKLVPLVRIDRKTVRNMARTRRQQDKYHKLRSGSLETPPPLSFYMQDTMRIWHQRRKP